MPSPHRYGASSSMDFAISRSQRSPLARSFALSAIESPRGSRSRIRSWSLDEVASTGQASWHELAIDAFHRHLLDVVAHGAAGAVVAAWPGFDGDGLGRANGLAKLAGDAAFLAIGIATQGVLAPKAWRRSAPSSNG